MIIADATIAIKGEPSIDIELANEDRIALEKSLRAVSEQYNKYLGSGSTGLRKTGKKQAISLPVKSQFTS